MKKLLITLIIFLISACSSQRSTSTDIPSNSHLDETSTTNPATTVFIPTSTHTFAPTSTWELTITPTPAPELTATSTPRPTNPPTQTPISEILQVISDNNAHLVQILVEIESPDDGKVLSDLEFAPHENLLAAGYTSDIIYQWRFPTLGNQIVIRDYSQNMHAGGGDNIAFSPDGRKIATSGFCRPVVLVQSSEHGDLLVEVGTTLSVDDLIFTPDSSILILAGTDRETQKTMIELWEVETNKRILTIEDIPAWYGSICSLAVNSDGTVLAAGFGNHQMKIWGLSGEFILLGKVLGIYGPDTCYSYLCGSSNTIHFQPNSNILASGTFNPRIPFRNIFTGSLELILSTKRETASVNPVTGETYVEVATLILDEMDFSPDGKVLAIAGWPEAYGWSEVQLRSTKTGELLAYIEFPGDDITDVSFSSDGYLLAVGSSYGNIYVLGINE